MQRKKETITDVSMCVNTFKKIESRCCFVSCLCRRTNTFTHTYAPETKKKKREYMKMNMIQTFHFYTAELSLFYTSFIPHSLTQNPQFFPIIYWKLEKMVALPPSRTSYCRGENGTVVVMMVTSVDDYWLQN